MYTDENGELPRRYFRYMYLISELSFLIAFVPPVLYPPTGDRIDEFVIIVPVQIITILILSSVAYILEKKYRKIEAEFGEYVVRRSSFYVLLTIVLPVFLYSVIYFFLLEPIIRFTISNILLVALFGFLMSNIPAALLSRRSKPLKDSYLKSKVDEIATTMAVKNYDLYVIDLDRFRIANAAQAGARRFRVFLSSYLIEQLSVDETVAVIAHELAHAKQRHVFKTSLFAWLILLISANVALIPVDVNEYPLVVYLGMIFGTIILLGGLILLIPRLQRRFEVEADLIAAQVVNGEYLISALEKITDLNMTPRELPRYWNLDHPSTQERVKRIREASSIKPQS